jgi:hypothetical protein
MPDDGVRFKSAELETRKGENMIETITVNQNTLILGGVAFTLFGMVMGGFCVWLWRKLQ